MPIVSSRLVRAPSGRVVAVEVTSAALPDVEAGHRYVVLGNLVDGAGKFRFLGEPSGRPPLPDEERKARCRVVARVNGSAAKQYPEAIRQRALDLVDAGASWAQAAREVGVHKSTVGDWVRRAAVAGNGDGSGAQSVPKRASGGPRSHAAGSAESA
jgi:transposase-like protein